MAPINFSFNAVKSPHWQPLYARATKQAQDVQRADMTSMVDAAMVEMKGIYPALRRSECERLIRAAIAASAAPAPQAQDVQDADGWYLQDTRSYVGNDVLWWAKDGNGYTTDLSKAHVYTQEEAFRQAAMRGTDRAWPREYIDGKTRPAVDMQYIKHEDAIAARAAKGGEA